MKKTLFILYLLLCAILAGCGSSSSGEPAEEPALPGPGILGGWTVSDSPEISGEVRTLFNEAMARVVGVNYEPVAYLGRQLVAGYNHALFCRATAVVPDAVPYYAVVILYEDLNAKATLSDIKALTPDGRFAENGGTGGTLAGGWSAPDSQDEGLAAFGKATEKLLGAEYLPIAVTGRQVVSGMNYCVFCLARAVTPDAEPCYCFARIYRDLNGNASLTDVTPLGE